MRTTVAPATRSLAITQNHRDGWQDRHCYVAMRGPCSRGLDGRLCEGFGVWGENAEPQTPSARDERSVTAS
jgi:hypothetical protein